MSATAQHFTLSLPEPDIAVLTFDMSGKGANILTAAVLAEFSEWLDDLGTRSDLAGLVIRSGKPGIYIAGADLREFVASFAAPKDQVVNLCRRGQGLFARLAAAPYVTVAAIDGVCVGGGAELAVWCDRRVLATSDKTEIGFPEVKIGLFPGWGGTVRTPRIVGLANAVELITGGESVDAQAARAMGLADDVAASDRLLAAAIDLIRTDQHSGQFLRDRDRRRGPLAVNDTELGFLAATASALIQEKTKGQYPAPVAALEQMLETAGLPADAALQREAEGMTTLFGSPVNQSLINVFFLNDRIKKDRGVAGDVAPREIASAAVVGAGIMGAGIAAANVKRRVMTYLTDSFPEALSRGVRGVLEEVSFNKKTKQPDIERAVEHIPLLHASTSDDELARCDLVIEAVVENRDAKRAVYARLEPLLRPDAILASNTSTIPITQLAAGLARPERFCGIHFFNPVRKMQLVEVIRGRQTSDETVATAVAYAKKVGKLPIVVNDGPGFLVNRLLLPYMNEALELLCEGAAIDEIDRAAQRFGLPMGPIALYDMVGMDTALFAGRTMAEAYPERVGQNPLLPALVAAGRLGQKSGHGFFSYRNPKGRPEPDASLEPLLAAHRRDSRKFTRDELTTRLFLPMVLEATRVLEERLVRDVRDVDFGLIYGIGFPPFKGGLLFWADMLGAAKLVEMLKPFETLGPRMTPTPLLKEMAAAGRKFYG